MKTLTPSKRHCIATVQLLISLIVILPHYAAYGRSSVEPKATLITRFPFTLTGRGIIIIKGKFGTYGDTLNFILDTGCGGISLDSATARNFNLTPTKSEDTILGLAQKKRAEFLFDQQLRLPGLVVNNLNFHINDYSFLTDIYNVKIDGVVGYSFLKLYIVKLNYDNRVMEVWNPGSMKYPESGFTMAAGLNKISSIDATVIDSKPVDSRFLFDTGADMCFLLSDKFIKDSSVLSSSKKIFWSEGEGLGGKKDMMVTTLDEVKIGPYAIKKVPVYIFSDDYNVANYPNNGGIMGNGLLHRFNMIINFPGNQLHLSPNSMYKDPFNYSYVGLSIATENGKLVVKNIIKDSPAHEAGLINDDIIFGINNNFRNDIDDYKTLFTREGAKLKVFFLRNNQIKSTTVEVKSIL